MRSGGIAIILLLAATALAGCMGQDASGATAKNEPLESGILAPASEQPAGALDPRIAPVWLLGDAWAVSTFGVGDEERAFLVVTDVASDSYTLSTTSESMAGFDAMFDVSYVGKIRASDLAGQQQGQPVKYFDFPLAEGKTWTTTWDGLEVALTATAAGTGFAVVGTVDGEPYVTYDYKPELKWWSRIEFVQDEYGMAVDRYEPGWTGEVLSATAEVVYEAAPTAPTATQGTGTFTIAEGQSYAMVTLVGGGMQWARAFGLLDPAGETYPTNTITNFDSELAGPRFDFLQERIEARPGEWRVMLDGVHDPSGGFFLTVHQVAVAATPFAGA